LLLRIKALAGGWQQGS